MLLNYYVYDDGPGASCVTPLFDQNGNPTALYHQAAAADLEYAKLGQSLRFLKSTDVRFLAGRHTVFGSITAENSTPDGLSKWSAGAGGNSHITSLSVSSGQLGSEKN